MPACIVHKTHPHMSKTTGHDAGTHRRQHDNKTPAVAATAAIAAAVAAAATSSASD